MSNEERFDDAFLFENSHQFSSMKIKSKEKRSEKERENLIFIFVYEKERKKENVWYKNVNFIYENLIKTQK